MLCAYDHRLLCHSFRGIRLLVDHLKYDMTGEEGVIPNYELSSYIILCSSGTFHTPHTESFLV